MTSQLDNFEPFEQMIIFIEGTAQAVRTAGERPTNGYPFQNVFA